MNQVSLLQSRQIIPQQCPGGFDPKRKFTHPFIEVLLMFAGESLCLVYFYFNMRKNGKKYKAKQDMAKFGGRPRSKVYFFALSSFLDFLQTCAYTVAIVHGGLAFSIFGAGRILIIALCMKCFTKIKLERPHIYGIILSAAGLCLIDLADIGNQTQVFQIWGFVLLLFSMFVSALHLIYQQHLLIRYYSQATRLVGFQGLFGMGYCIIIILIFNFSACPLDHKYCVCFDGNLYIENISAYFSDIADQPLLILFAIMIMITCAIHNALSVTVINSFNALGRTVIHALTMPPIWMIGIILTLAIDTQSNYGKYESLDLLVITIKVVGFALLIFGTLIYFQFVGLKCFAGSPKRVSYEYQSMPS